MSLLSNLLQFSSLSRSNELILTKSQNKQRSNSFNGQFFSSIKLKKNQNNKSQSHKIQQQSSLQKCRKNLSKSLSKINMREGKIDPKMRNIHRLVQQLSRKCRRHYYTFFVHLQTMKKKNITIRMISMSKQDIQKQQNKINRLVQTYQIIFTKLYQKNLKKQFFIGIKKFSTQKLIIGKMIQIFDNNNNLVNKIKFFEKLRQIDNSYMRIDILVNSIKSANQSLQRKFKQCFNDNQQFNENLEFIHQAFNQIKEYSDQKKFKQNKTNLQESQKKYQTPKRSEKYSFSSLEFLQAVQLQEKSKSTQLNQVSKLNYLTPIQTENYFQKNTTHLQFSSEYLSLAEKTEKYKIQREYPIQISKHISPMNKKFVYFSIKNDKNSSWKSYQIKTQIDQKQMSSSFCQQAKQKAYPKMQPDFLFVKEIGDFYDKIDIFMKMKPQQKQSCNKANQYQQSNVNSVYGIQTIAEKLDRIPDSFDFKQTQGNAHTRLRSLNNSSNQKAKSQIVYGTPGFSYRQSNAKIRNDYQKINQSEYDQSFNDTNFGSEAVSFKNSLVHQRQSMKKHCQQYCNTNNFKSQKVQYYPTYGQKYSDFNSSSEEFSAYQYQKRKYQQNNFYDQTKKKSFDKYVNLKNNNINYQQNSSRIPKPISISKTNNNNDSHNFTCQSIKFPSNNKAFIPNSHQNYNHQIRKDNFEENKIYNHKNLQFHNNSYKYQNSYFDSFTRNTYSVLENYHNSNSNNFYKNQNSFINNSNSININGKVKTQFQRNSKKLDLNLSNFIPSNDQIKMNTSSQWNPNLQKNNYSLTTPTTPKEINSKVRSISFTGNNVNAQRNSLNNTEIYDKIKRNFPQSYTSQNYISENKGGNSLTMRQSLNRPVKDTISSSDGQKKNIPMKIRIPKPQKQIWGNSTQENQFIKLRSRRQSFK